MGYMKEKHSMPEGIEDFLPSSFSDPSCDKCVARNVSMCSVLDDQEIVSLSDISNCMQLSPSTIICAEGDDADHLFNIQEGCVRASKMLSDGRRQIIGFFFPGEFFGLACANGYTYTCESITEVRLCRMPRPQILQKFKDIPKLGQKVLDITRIELQSTQDQMLLLGRKSAKEKLCSFLISIADKSHHIRHIQDDTIYLPMSRSDIADYLGLTIETISRQFTILSKEGLISLSENCFVKILDVDRLKNIASCE